MSTLFVEDDVDVDALMAHRRSLGLDGRDEIWDGVCHVTPSEHRRNARTAQRLATYLAPAADRAGLEASGPFNLGTPRDFRIPDLGFIAADADDEVYNDTSAIVVEVLSPRDETFQKFSFYAAHRVEEVWVIDPLERSVRIWQLTDNGSYTETGRSDLLDLTSVTVQTDLAWPRA